MKKIISLVAVLLIILMTGCSYIGSMQDEGVTYIDLTELMEDGEESQDIIIIDEVIVEEIEFEEEENVEEIIETTVKEIPTLKVIEGDTVALPNLRAADPDGDKIIYHFSEPLDENGEWETEEGDAGEYTSIITASDGTSEISQEIRIIVEELNKAPVLEEMSDIIVNEGETLKLTPKSFDPEGEPLTITYSGWMNSDTKELDYNSAGEYIVRITASDGSKETYLDVKITVEDVNRPPEFVSII